MPQSLALATLVVADYDDAIAFYVGKLGFTLTADQPMGDKRWVTVTPPGSQGGLLLAKASGEAQGARVGDPTGGRVAFILHTDDFDRDHAAMTAAGVAFLEPPRREPYGIVAVFEDLYGVRWDLLQSA